MSNVQKDRIAKIEEALQELRPFLHKDGGDVEFVRFDEQKNVVYIRWLGKCTQCSMTPMTKAGIEAAIRNKLPQVVGVKAVEA